MTDCNSEFRLFWLQQKFAEDAPNVSVHHPQKNPYPFVILPWYPCDSGNLEQVYSLMPVPFTRDGLLFLHRESHYEAALTPLMLVWKDQNCSTYLSEVYQGVDPSIQVVCLQVLESGALLTCDEPPCTVATVPPEILPTVQKNNRGLALFKIEGISISDQESMEDADGAPTVSVANIEFFSIAAAKRAEADSMSKLLFQQALRTQPLSVEEIASAASSALVPV
mmetsp:Transcript_11597/g.18215  ORF Transcript_11597/g.18215 Transcript_11597/m.18215 type:complete len:223 (-) Transcript_11597:81-749(-)